MDIEPYLQSRSACDFMVIGSSTANSIFCFNWTDVIILDSPFWNKPSVRWFVHINNYLMYDNTQ